MTSKIERASFILFISEQKTEIWVKLGQFAAPGPVLRRYQATFMKGSLSDNPTKKVDQNTHPSPKTDTSDWIPV